MSDRLILIILSIAVLTWVIAAMNMMFAIYEHNKYINNYLRRLKLPKPDFYDPRVNKWRRSYWQRINNIETQ